MATEVTVKKVTVARQGTKTPSGGRMKKKKKLGRNQAQSEARGHGLLWPKEMIKIIIVSKH